MTDAPAIPDAAQRDLAEARLATYRFLLAAMEKPTPEQHAWFRSPEFRRSLETLCATFELPCPDGELAPAEFTDFASRYLACFEVGLPTPPVVLQASHYNRREPVPATIHEHVLFYHRFGTHPSAANIEPADHLTNELAFLIRLDELLLTDGNGTDSIRHARQDFLSRQVTRWLARAATGARELHLPEVYTALLDLLAHAAEQDLELCETP